MLKAKMAMMTAMMTTDLTTVARTPAVGVTLLTAICKNTAMPWRQMPYP